MIARRAAITSALGLSSVALLAACHQVWKLDPQDLDMRGHLPDLAFTMTDAATGKIVTAADYRGKIVLLYFGYTNCPDVCPLTLYEMTKILASLGSKTKDVRFLFVTVDPLRDTLPVLAKYIGLYHTPEFIGLRGSNAELQALASRFHAGYSVHPSANPADYTVTHTAAAYVFNRRGKAEFICAGLSATSPDLAGIAKDLRHLIATDSI
ncbi:MAG: SCO family protein [Acidiphilium sp.]|nr:SCO family protein [Acidiphilium sp.]MDD4934796.1 SCO family protein [Acidiphilium sp.]